MKALRTPSPSPARNLHTGAPRGGSEGPWPASGTFRSSPGPTLPWPSASAGSARPPPWLVLSQLQSRPHLPLALGYALRGQPAVLILSLPQRGPSAAWGSVALSASLH